MATNFTKIQDEKLRQLCQNSVSINYLPESERQAVIDKIAGLTPEKQAQVIALLENEQKQIKESATAQTTEAPQAANRLSIAPQTAEQQMQEIEAAKQQLTAIEHEYDAKIRNINEEESRTQDSIAAENLLNLLEKL